MNANAVASYYTRGDLRSAVLAALVASGHDPDALDIDALPPFDDFHTLGRAATAALADAAAISSADLVLDVGSGMGGPARYLAHRFGCHVDGVDLTPELCDVATDLTGRVGLADRAEFRVADALDLPFASGRFDVAWTQHVSMNIADKPALYAELRRVVRTGGRLAFFDILAGPESPIHFPVPWADDAAVSFLATADETHEAVTAAGFAVRVWDDLTAEAHAFYGWLAQSLAQPSPLDLSLLVANAKEKAETLVRNTTENRLAIVRCVADAV